MELSPFEFVAIIVAVVGGVEFTRSLMLLLAGKTADGKVVALDVVYQVRRAFYYPVVEYRAGRTLRRERVRIGQRPAGHHVGERVQVLYGRSGKQPMIRCFNDLWFRPLICFCLSAAVFILRIIV